MRVASRAVHALCDTRAACHAAHHVSGAMPVEPAAVCVHDPRPVCVLADSQVDGPRGARRERGGYDLAALAVDHQGPVPALDARAWMSALVASDTRRPFRASSEISACSAAGPSPAATRSARRVRCGRARWSGTRSPEVVGGRARRVSGRGALLRRRSGRTRRRCANRRVRVARACPRVSRSRANSSISARRRRTVGFGVAGTRRRTGAGLARRPAG